MKWVLLFLEITSSTDFNAYEVGRFESMIECFSIRDEVLVSLGAYDGIPPINTQLICVRTEYE